MIILKNIFQIIANNNHFLSIKMYYVENSVFTDESLIISFI